MKQSVENKLKITKKILFAIVGVLITTVLIFSIFSVNTIIKFRSEGGYTIVEDVEFENIGNGFTVQNQFSFKLYEIGHAETLAFFMNHHDIQVYIGNECVYSMIAGDTDKFVTSGGAWVMIPLSDGDAGKVVRVVLTPLYDNYNDVPEFFLGSEIAIHNATLHRALPIMILSLCVMFTGMLLISFALYQSVKGMKKTGRMYALGCMAVSAGLWRITYDKVAYLFFENSSVLIYNLSIVSLMVVAISMLNVIEKNDKNKNVIRMFSCIYCLAYIVQLILQLVGVFDLRQTLKIIHITLILSAMMFVFDSVVSLSKMKTEKTIKFNYSDLLGIGVIIDLIIYYFAETSLKMFFTLIAILCFSVLEGVSLMFVYIEQKTVLEEMENQLALSRATTMMSQIRSHFVFNILNAISGMCKYDPEKADETVVLFSRYLRNNIEIMENDNNIPFEKDLRQLEDYVALEQIRFGDKIEFYSDIEIDDFMIPPLIVQPVVENAIKHGVSKKQGNGNIILRTRDMGDNIVISVIDDGVGFDMSELDKEHSVGLRNIRFRLEHLVNGKFEIESELGKGTTATITIPKEKK